MKHQQHKKKKIVVVSTFSGMDLFMLGLVYSGMLPGYAIERNIYAALMHADNFRNPDGSSVIEFVDISQDEFERRKKYRDQNGKKTLEDTCIKKDGRYIRAKEIKEVSGKEIREDLERKYGKDLIIILIGGPPCQDFTKLNSKKKTGNGSRNYLVFEYLRILDELEPDIGIMEEVPELKTPEFEDIYEAFIKQALTMPYMIAEQEMRSIHYGGNQNRERIFILFVHKKLGVDPEFPEADELNVKRVRDFLDIDYFCHGIYNYSLKDKNHFMPTVTSSNPTAFFKDDQKYQPPIDDLLLCFDVGKGIYTIPEGIPQVQIRKAIGNAVCVSVSKAFAKIITEKILCVRPLDNGYWISIDDSDDLYNNLEWNHEGEINPEGSVTVTDEDVDELFEV
ncbi:MAG: DNA cytosine methyltransferase [Bacteroidetes bacterium]|nr:DNA cytosine methyltransferase [Bacteroidota bacterium]